MIPEAKHAVSSLSQEIRPPLIRIGVQGMLPAV
jgi:hypothetical protein